MKSFGAKVKEQRGNLGLSQKQLAEKAGMGIRTITSYELGERKPYQAQLYKPVSYTHLTLPTIA